MTTKKARLDDELRAGVGANVGTKLQELITAVNELKEKFNAHLQDGSHTAAANQTAGNVTANTIAFVDVTDDLDDEVHE